MPLACVSTNRRMSKLRSLNRVIWLGPRQFVQYSVSAFGQRKVVQVAIVDNFLDLKLSKGITSSSTKPAPEGNG